MEERDKALPKVKGWGIDRNPKNDPTYPMKDRTDDEHKGYDWERPTQQPIDIEVLHSIERPNVSAVFGTSVPPKGLSGIIRRFAFQFGEAKYSHWLPLILADRVNVVEGIVDDLKRGHVPNIFAEKGMNASWKYNRKGLIRKAVVGAAVASVAMALMLRNSKTKKG